MSRHFCRRTGLQEDDQKCRSPFRIPVVRADLLEPLFPFYQRPHFRRAVLLSLTMTTCEENCSAWRPHVPSASCSVAPWVLNRGICVFAPLFAPSKPLDCRRATLPTPSTGSHPTALSDPRAKREIVHWQRLSPTVPLESIRWDAKSKYMCCPKT
jgi:hypothetical protein